MSAADRLIGKAHDYEVLAASHSEREALVGGGEHLAAATAFTVAALVMREVLLRSRTSGRRRDRSRRLDQSPVWCRPLPLVVSVLE